MKTETKTIIEFAGIAGVIASLVFVGMQFILDRQVALAQQYHSRAESRMENVRTEANNERLMSSRISAWERGDRPDWWDQGLESELQPSDNAEEIELKMIFGRLALLDFDNMHYQFQQGMLSGDTWLNYRSRLKEILRSGFDRKFYLRYSYRGEFVSLLSNIISEIESESNRGSGT